jgi:hypothetical protein
VAKRAGLKILWLYAFEGSNPFPRIYLLLKNLSKKNKKIINTKNQLKKTKGDIMDTILKEVFNTQNLNIINEIPETYKLYLIILVYVLFITIYSILIWKFYRFLARRDILKIDLSKYNRSKHHLSRKLFAGSAFILKYALITPIIVSFWFVFFSIFLLLLSQEQTILQVLIISVSMIAAIRITSYYSEDLSKDLSKMFPFTALAIFLLSSKFDFNIFLEKAAEIPLVFNNILIFLGFLAVIEVFLRVIFIFCEINRTEEEVN